MSTILEAARVLRGGGVMAYPGDTYYALGANIYNNQAVAKVMMLKGLVVGQELIPVAVDSILRLEDIVQLGSDHRSIVEELWPGPIMFLLPKKDSVSSLLVGPSNLIGVVCFRNDLVARLIQKAGFPITATSANLVGRKQVSRPDELKISSDGVIKGLCPFAGKELTIVDLFNGRIIQEGVWGERVERLIF